MNKEERKLLVRSYLDKKVTVKIDRPIGYVHKKEKYTLTYPINYGYLPGVIGGDDEELDVYILGVDKPVSEFSGRIIGIIYRKNDVEDKLVAAPDGVYYNQAEIAAAVNFQEQYYKTKVDAVFHKSCGVIPYKYVDGERRYLLLLQKKSQTWSFPKGHTEIFETEEQNAKRELFEETGLNAELNPDFRFEVHYDIMPCYRKTVVLFLAKYCGDIKLLEDEICDSRWVTSKEAMPLLSTAYEGIFEKIEEVL